MQAEFIYFDTRPREDKLWVREHMTIGGRCIQNSTILSVHRENGTFSKTEGDKENFGHLLLLRDPRSFMLAFSLEDEHNRGLSFYADAPEASSEQQEEFREAIRCVGLRTSEILYVDWKKVSTGASGSGARAHPGHPEAQGGRAAGCAAQARRGRCVLPGLAFLRGQLRATESGVEGERPGGRGDPRGTREDPGAGGHPGETHVRSIT